MRWYFMLRHGGYPEEKCQSAYFNCGKSYGFSLLNKDTQYLLIFKANFDFIWIWIICHGSCSHLHMRKLTWTFRMYLQQRRKRQDTTHVTLKLMKVNLPAHEVCTTPSMNKKRNHLIYCDCSRWISSAIVKNVVWTVFQGRFSTEDKQPWLCLLFFHFISTRAENPCSQR